MVRIFKENRCRNLKKQTRRKHYRNRYYIGSKISEYHFTLILKAFAHNVPANVLSEQIRISSKTVRAIYSKLRTRLPIAIMLQPDSFGGAGLFLFKKKRLSQSERYIFKKLSQNRTYHQWLKSLKQYSKKGTNLSSIIEYSIRSFCCLDYDVVAMKATRHNYKAFETEIDYILDQFSDLKFKGSNTYLFENRFRRIKINLERLIHLEQTLWVLQKAKLHNYPNHIFYECLKKHLNQAPLKANNKNA